MTQTSEKVEIIGANAFGETRKFTFQLMNSETGLEVFHTTVSGLVDMAADIACLIPALKKIMEDFDTDKDAELAKIEAGNIGAELVQLVQLIPKVLTFDKIKYLAKNMLAGCEVEGEAIAETIPESGIGNYTARDPLEIYAGIVFGVAANYPKYIASFTTSRETGEPGKGSTPMIQNTGPVKMTGPGPRQTK